ncbi:MAG: NAD(P)-dependent oxidoreductase [Alphaproteobacteria bacterium]|nr:NAD(P)-dependent oxidoreductase [Alphaproteobacteria bacterium]
MATTIAFLGIGLMGEPMSANLVKAGFAVTVWNRSAAKANSVVKLGAKRGTTPEAATSGADIIITMLENGPIVREVLFEQGAAKGIKSGALVIDMSSIPPDYARAHAKRLKTECKADYLDAPVSGGTVGAAEASLAIMAGGEAAVFERARPILATMGRPTLVGPTGTGQLAKLCNQAIVGINIIAVAEALLLAAAGGADPAAVRKAITGGFADSKILQVHGQRMLERKFLPGGRSHVHLKDLNSVLDAANEVKLDLPLSKATRGIFNYLVEIGGGRYDQSAALLAIEHMNKPARVGTAPDILPTD